MRLIFFFFNVNKEIIRFVCVCAIIAWSDIARGRHRRESRRAGHGWRHRPVAGDSRRRGVYCLENLHARERDDREDDVTGVI